MTLSIIALNSECCHAEFPVLLSVIYAQYHIQALYAECRYTECRYVKCHYAERCYAECRSADKNTSLQ
jgi:hypothetical protein